MSFHNTTNHKSQKERKCKLCNGDIKKGDQYSKSVGSSDGDFYSYVTHVSCQNIMDLYFEIDDYGVSFECVYDWAVEKGHFDNHKNDCGGE